MQAGMGQEERGCNRGEQPLQNDQGVKGVGECPCSFSGLLPGVRNTLNPVMDLLVQDPGPLLARDLADRFLFL